MTFNKWLIILMALMIATDIAILLDIPVLRQVLGFVCFTTLPGLLILYALKLNYLSPLKRFLLSVGLSLSFLIFFGLLVNTLFPWLGYPRPLSTPSLVISASLALVILGLVAYLRNKENKQLTLPKLRAYIKDKHLSLLLLPILFPLLAVIGRYTIDTGGSNVILMALFFLIPLYVVLLMWRNKKVPEITYPLAIGMISLSLLLSRALISDYLIGGDIYSEYHSFQVVAQNLHWSLEAERSNASASLSVSLLPAMLQSLIGANPVYMYKAVLLLPIALIPVIGYVIYEKYMGRLYGFLSAFFYMAQLPFIYLLSAQIRVGIALISFSLLVMILFDKRLVGLNKTLLILAFLFSMVVEYYVLPIIFVFIMIVLWLVPRIWKKGSFDLQTVSITSAIIMPAILVYFWWGQLTATALNEYIYYTKYTLANLSNLFAGELRGGEVTSLYTLASHLTFAQQIPGFVQRITFITISIGVVSILVRKEQRLKFGNYSLLMAACLALLTVFILLPWVSIGYGADRAYIQPLVILAPAFIVGCQEIARGIRTFWIYSSRFFRFTMPGRYFQSIPSEFLPAMIIGGLLVCQFFSSSYLYNQLVVPDNTREILDKNSSNYAIDYVYEGEVQAARWLGANNQASSPVYMGNIRQRNSGEVFEYTDYITDREFDIYPFTKEEPVENSYIFLNHLNVTDGLINGVAHEHGVSVTSIAPLAEYAHLYADKHRIYANGDAEVYR